jgi:hypothetical protein
LERSLSPEPVGRGDRRPFLRAKPDDRGGEQGVIVTDPPARARRSFFVRSIYAGRDLEFFMVTAIATILVVRAALAASGWPQLGGGKIHFAHLLWGGLGMLIALVMFMAMRGRLWQLLATLSAGIGFGLFIDELGKFITSDNDYFFQPVVAIIYLVFVALFLVGLVIVRGLPVSPQSALVNALSVAQEAVIHDLDEAEQTQALSLLASCDQKDPMVRDLTHMLADRQSLAKGPPRFYLRLKARLQGFYNSLLRWRWFETIIVSWFVLVDLGGLLVGILIAVAAAAGQSQSLELDFWGFGGIVSSAVSGALVVVGLLRWRHSRLAAYHWFERALLVTIFVTEFFAFYQSQFAAVFGLAVVLLTFATIRFMIGEEEARRRAQPVGSEALPA